jgi:signal transduction histidine kinase/CheY-like chemotaxis protein
MQEGAVTISAEGLSLYANQRFADMAGQPLMRVISARASDYLSPSTWEKISGVFESLEEVVKCETQLQRSGQTPLPVNLTASHLPYEGQELLCLVVTDLSGQKQSESLRLAKEVAEKANAAKDTFLAALSHELRTPLNPVLMLASEAAQNPDLPPNVRADFATICKSVELESRLIDDLLDLTRITHGKMALEPNVIDGHVVLKNALTTIEPDLEAKSISLSVALDAQCPTIKADAVRLQQVFWNVLKNAVKFTPERGSIKVSTEAQLEKGQWLVTISDSGIGLSREELAEVFEVFAQGDHARTHGGQQFGGLGLGLSISRKIVEMHSGTIRGQSDGRGKGATFIIELPLTQTAPDRVANVPLSAPRPFIKDQGPAKLRILLVEDHESTRVVLTSLLLKRRHAVTAASTAGEARALARNNTFDLVISDIGLPDEDGFGLMKELSSRYQLKGIALTGYGAEQDFISSQQSGFLAHLTKPIRIESLEKALSAAFAGSKFASG